MKVEAARLSKGKRKVAVRKARRTVQRRAVPERMRSERRVDEVTHGAGNYGTNGPRDNAGPQEGKVVSLATNAAPKMNDQLGKSDLLQRPDTVAWASALYPEAPAAALAALQVWFLLPLRILQSWQEAWFRLLPR